MIDVIEVVAMIEKEMTGEMIDEEDVIAEVFLKSR